MTATPTATDFPPTPAAMPHRRGGVRRALRRAWRECLVPIDAGDTAAIAAVRGVARSALAWWGVPGERSSDVLLALSELATNALVHTTGPVRVRLTCRSRTIRMDIADASPGVPQPMAPGLAADAPHGWGLTIAETLADRLTVTTVDTGAGKIVTAEFDF
ncbi:ATP-binding protein [Actinocrinis puniceicyclus]|uniref:ATP-binding protein n=1 Tax=Actinocrinis puniceicyclus TaxID=977794 RepID=A0A8J7WQ01_9ACTN|nr:ATP-binding protein [Actinocrinis puniceicyclus]MBS2966541.1 ATP-binding protein [Actinocrinis puniceicyclus]